MSKPKMYGAYACYVPNARADMRYRRKVYQRGREKARIIINYQKVGRSKEGENG
jgi:hypothetical protein